MIHSLIIQHSSKSQGSCRSDFYPRKDLKFFALLANIFHASSPNQEDRLPVLG